MSYCQTSWHDRIFVNPAYPLRLEAALLPSFSQFEQTHLKVTQHNKSIMIHYTYNQSPPAATCVNFDETQRLVSPVLHHDYSDLHHTKNCHSNDSVDCVYENGGRSNAYETPTKRRRSNANEYDRVNTVSPMVYNTSSIVTTTGLPDTNGLVRSSDLYDSTRYMCFVISQYRKCIFQESDRHSRGGKRDNIAVGFAGLACVHCNTPASKNGAVSEDDSSIIDGITDEKCKGRKFFWSGVDRMSNSFSEFHNHIARCRKCPSSVQYELDNLKKSHAFQKTTLKKGSTKFFLSRVWDRLHNPSEEQEEKVEQMEGVSSPESVSSPSQMRNELFDEYLFREHIDIFQAKTSDVLSSQISEYPLETGCVNVGLRCRHCHMEAKHRLDWDEVDDIAMDFTYYPIQVGDIKDCVDELFAHLCTECPNVPENRMQELTNDFTMNGRDTWYEAKVSQYGIVDMNDGNGISFTSTIEVDTK